MIRKPTRALLFAAGILAAAVTASLSVKRVVTAAALQADPAPAPPARVGTQAAGSFADATGHSGQSHLVYAANAGVWWLFTLTSSADSAGGANHIVKAYRSSGAQLATAVWTAAADSPGASVSAGFAPNGFMGGGRALGVVYVNNAPADIIHAEVAMAADGQDGITGHIRARLTATGITWESWNYKVEGAATWTLPRAVSLGLSNGKVIHSGGPTLQQEVDANARRSNNADTGAAWTSGFSSVVVIDNSMLHQCNAMAFAPLAGETMLAVYDNGRGTEPGQTNLRYKRSNANGTWTGVVVGSQLGGDGDVFAATAAIDQNDWALVALNSSAIRAYRRNAAGTGVDAAAYNPANNTWSAAPAPPAFGPGQAFKSGGGLFGAKDGNSTWLFVINADAANTILYTMHDGTAWSAWAAVPGTTSGTHSRRFLSGHPTVAAGQIGLTWTEGATSFDIFTAALPTAPPAADITAPTVSLLAPADGSTVFGAVSISASASDDRALARVQFQVDGANLGPAQTSAPFGATWDSRTVANGTHSIAAIATDAAGNSGSAFASVSVSNRPVISAVSAAALTTTSESIAWTTDIPATSVVDYGQTTAYGASASNTALVTSHQITLSGLLTGTTYHYQVTSADSAGNASSAGDFTFTTSAPDTTAPTIVTRTPAVNATGVSTATTVRVTFSEAMNASTINGTTISLRNANNTLVTATVAYNASTFAATLTPSAALAAGQTYTATVTGGSAGVTDAAGNALAASAVWSFTTAAAATDTVSITRLEYTVSSRQLRVEAQSSSSSAVLTAFVTSSGTQIGSLSNNGSGRYRGTFTLATNPQNVTVRSSLGGQASAAVVAK
jgi:Big-like domain-containing protein